MARVGSRLPTWHAAASLANSGYIFTYNFANLVLIRYITFSKHIIITVFFIGTRLGLSIYIFNRTYHPLFNCSFHVIDCNRFPSSKVPVYHGIVDRLVGLNLTGQLVDPDIVHLLVDPDVCVYVW